MTRHAVALLALLLAAACAGPQRPDADAVTQAACGQRADQVYNLRHPEAVYNEDTYTSSLRDAPFGTNGTPSLPTKGLSDDYERGELLRDCLDGTGGIGPTQAAPPLAGPEPTP